MVSEDLFTQRVVNGLTIEDLTDKIEIVGLGFTKDIAVQKEVRKKFINGRLVKLEIPHSASLNRTNVFTLKPLNEDIQSYLLFIHRKIRESLDGNNNTRWNIKYKDKIIYNVRLKDFKNDVWNCSCDWFEQDRGLIR